MSKARELLKELRILYVRGREAHIEEPRNVALLFGTQQEAIADVGEMSEEWKELKKDLTKTVEQLLLDAKGQLSDETKIVFLQALEKFTGGLRKMNTVYLRSVLARLSEVLR